MKNRVSLRLFLGAAFLCAWSLSPCSAARLNEARLVLPINTGKPASYELHVMEGGGECYSWTSSRPELMLVEAEDPVCSTRAFVRAVGTEPSTNVILIEARDPATGEIFVCQGFLVTIAKIQLLTTSKELFLDDHPASFEIQAYDPAGNHIHSVNSVVCDWNVESDMTIDNGKILRILTFAESKFGPPNHEVAELEERGLRGHKVLVEALHIGMAVLRVKLAHSVFKNVEADSVRVSVVANLLLKPNIVYLAPHTTIQLELFQIKRNDRVQLSFPSRQYHLQVSDSSIAHLDEERGVVTALRPGNVDIVLRYSNMKYPESMRPTATLMHVVDPAYMSIAFLPHRNNALISGEEYELAADIFSRNDHAVTLADGLEVSMGIPARHLKSLYTARNGSYARVLARDLGTAVVTAELKSVVDMRDGSIYDLPEPISASAPFEVFARVQVKPRKVILPFIAGGDKTYEIAFTATGGDGKYTWTTKDGSQMMVAANGVAKIASSSTNGHVEAAMIRNKKNADVATITLMPAEGLAIVDGVREAVVGSKISLGLALYPNEVSKTAAPFTHCHLFSFDVTTSNEKSFRAEGVKATTGATSACASLDVKGLVVGSPNINVAGAAKDGSILKTSAVVSFYNKLRLLGVSSEDGPNFILAVGSWFTVKFSGGPLPWVDNPKQHYTQATVDDTAKLISKTVQHMVSEDGDGGIYGLDVACLQEGETTIKIVVGNKPSKTLPMPVEETMTVRIACGVPGAVELIVENLRDSAQRGLCPMASSAANSGAIPASCTDPTNFLARIVDTDGRPFHGLSSLRIHWILTSEVAGSLAHTGDSKVDSDMPGVLRNSLKPGGSPGTATVQVAISGYKPDASLSGQPVHWTTLKPLSATLKLNLVKQVALTPSKLAVFNHPSSVAKLGIDGGSGVFNVVASTGGVVGVHLNAQRRVVELKPVADGMCELKVVDLCLPFESSAIVSVSGVASVELHAVSKLQVGRVVDGVVKIFNKQGHQIQGESLSLLKLIPLAPTDKLHVEVIGIDETNSEFKISIEGITVGTAKLLVEVEGVKSLPLNMNIFPGLRVTPRNITLVPGAVMQVTVEGGPQPGGLVSYTIYDVEHHDKGHSKEKIAVVSDNGVVRAMRLGLAQLRVEAHGLEGPTTEATVTNGDHLTVYSSDMVFVHVVNITKAYLHVPVKVMEKGTEMTATFMGMQNSQRVSPIAFGTANPGLHIEWSVTPRNIVILESQLGGAKILDSATAVNRFAVRLRAQEPGEVVLTLRVTSTVPETDRSGYQIYRSIILEESVQITVEDILYSTPNNGLGVLYFLTPNSYLKLGSNKPAGKWSALESAATVHLSPDGNLRAGSQPASVVARLSYAKSRQDVFALITVKPYRYFNVVARGTQVIESVHDVHSIPVGSRVELEIQYCDEFGRLFHATSSSVDKLLSRHDILRVQTLSSSSQGSSEVSTTTATTTYAVGSSVLSVECLQKGDSVMKIYDTEDRKISEYIHIVCESYIYPSDLTVNVGDAICFDSPLLFHGTTGFWSSSGAKILPISREHGVGVAKEPGKVTVFYGSTDGSQKTHVSVDVLPAGGIELIHGIGLGGVSVAEGAVVSIPARIVTQTRMDDTTGMKRLRVCTEDKLRNAADIPLPITCSGRFERGENSSAVRFDSVFDVRAGLDPETASLSCLVRRRPTYLMLTTKETEELASLTSSFVVVKASLESGATSNEVRLPLYPPFSVHLGGEGKLEVSSVQSTATMTITADETVMSSIQFIPSNDNYINVPRPTKLPDGSEWAVIVHVTPAFWKVYGVEKTPLTLTISSPLTGQKTAVTLEPVGHGGDAETIRQCAARLSEDIPWGTFNIKKATTGKVYLFLFSWSGLLAIAILVLSYIVLYSNPASWFEWLKRPATAGAASSGPFQPQMHRGTPVATSTPPGPAYQGRWTTNTPGDTTHFSGYPLSGPVGGSPPTPGSQGSPLGSFAPYQQRSLYPQMNDDRY